ncbi:MAG TPA: hypothetical protein VJS65_14345 [Verrucomicrobiae bacterium]|nr:hypothetical protein [Verrucomicrobiae bacterium]
MRLDRRLAGFARKRGLAYTRYADDLSFSGDIDRGGAMQARQIITRIVESEGFKVNVTKTRLMGQGTRQTVTGVVVNQTLGLSRQVRRRMRAAAHQLRNGSRLDSDGRQAAHLEGKLAYLSMLNKDQAARLRTMT